MIFFVFLSKTLLKEKNKKTITHLIDYQNTTKTSKHCRHAINYASKESDYQQLSLILHFQNSSLILSVFFLFLLSISKQNTHGRFLFLSFFLFSQNIK